MRKVTEMDSREMPGKDEPAVRRSRRGRIPSFIRPYFVTLIVCPLCTELCSSTLASGQPGAKTAEVGFREGTGGGLHRLWLGRSGEATA